MKTSSCRQLSLTRPMSASSRQQLHGLLARKFRGVDAPGIEKMGLLLLPIPLQASAGKSTAK